ncbi:hypothetical protein CLAFUW4_07861 [Fulvia fulva]|uniref:Histone deacetylase complex subunit SAP30 Sin3 binding domain-containing protein n=1 Tax=Passalora fulva TaxID=5499 RepID=A0A9Q8P6B6_PASFU|nr:uncharacterized protein CLAFUR5_07986 [Fulvia fulva]KAK4629524.1 hypothetical protein CLAFUR4_07866 [Fulvia fulva]KAK4630172.1 hypothetical protein CLAFUR0_07863 [Fulvia fulva]UJO14657.1 hypothetical protein CLAFUR5_07986 [Fulvia fulva]WPV12672.1 hypothetical protein CLAFUW4_07861 [Fulvia fulva]WPV27136.1 hypothetical protein CLAFUW7_07862 [Fulvia fulva]
MPPAKSSDAKTSASTVRERQIAAAAHARSMKNGAQSHQNGVGSSSLREFALLSTDNSAVAGAGQGPALNWPKESLELLNTYRVSHNLSTPAAFTTPYRQALLTNPGIGRQSPTMARKKDKRRVAKDQLALAVRKNFNGAAVNEIDVVVDMVYKVRNQDKVFRMRSTPAGVTKKQ